MGAQDDGDGSVRQAARVTSCEAHSHVIAAVEHDRRGKWSRKKHLEQAFAGRLACQLGLLDSLVRVVGQLLLVGSNVHIELREVDNLAILDFPELLSDLRDESEVVRDNLCVCGQGCEATGSADPQENATDVRTTTPPSNSLMARARASMEVISRWFVGSSNSSTCGCSMASCEKTTRLRRPSESCLMGDV